MKNMKSTKNIKSALLAALCLFAVGFMNSCEDDVVLKTKVNEENYDKVNHVYGSLVNTVDARLNAVVELRTTEKKVDLRIDLTKSFDAAIDATMRLDQELADAYNADHKTDFEMLPTELISVEEDGAVLIAPGDIKSVPVTITIKPSNSLTMNKTYIVPLTTDVITDGLRLDNLDYVLLVTYLGTVPDCSKTPDVKIISCMEVNNVNPLNNLQFTLAGSGKMLIDIVVLFSANIRYDAATGKVYLHCNDNITALLNNRDKYIKPLQDHGMKVVLGVMGDHTVAGVANLSDAMAVEFAAELKSFCDAYNLDGIYYDDEYGGYAPSPGFVFPASSSAAARLVYETKKAMPEKLCMVYIFRLLESFQTPVDGVDPGMFIDYATSDYGVSASVNSYKGITMKQLSPYSQEFALDKPISEEAARGLSAAGFGANMIFALDPFRPNFMQLQISGMEALAKGIFNDNLTFSYIRLPKDW